MYKLIMPLESIKYHLQTTPYFKVENDKELKSSAHFEKSVPSYWKCRHHTIYIKNSILKTVAPYRHFQNSILIKFFDQEGRWVKSFPP